MSFEELEMMQLKEENESLRELLRRFCIKSNGVSIYARSDWRSSDRVKEDIMKMYEFQCEVEQLLNKGGE